MGRFVYRTRGHNPVMKPEDAARRLLEDILARYTSLEEFLGLLRVDPLVDTTELPPISAYLWTIPTIT